MIQKNHSFAFVDGSFNKATNTYGWGGFLIDEFGHKHILQGSGKKVALCAMHNVAGEILGAADAMQTALKLGMKELTIYYDYEGIEKWVTGKWCARKRVGHRVIEGEKVRACKKCNGSLDAKFVRQTKKEAKKETKKYVKFAESAIKNGLKLSFKHVKAHSGIPFNEEADNLAKKSVGLE